MAPDPDRDEAAAAVSLLEAEAGQLEGRAQELRHIAALLSFHALDGDRPPYRYVSSADYEY